MSIRGIKCVIIGDGAIGKTSLIHAFIQNNIPQDYIPTIFDNYSRNYYFYPRREIFYLSLWDTAGQEDYDHLRPFSYSQVDVFILCYSCISPVSLENIIVKWHPEIKKHAPKISCILIGTKADLVDDPEILRRLEESQSHPVSRSEGDKVAEKIGAFFHTSCSAIKDENVDLIFESAIWAFLTYENQQENRRRGCILI